MNQNQKPYKKLYRSRRERMIAGICGSLAEYFGMDPTWMRLLFFIILFLSGGIIIFIYLLMWILVPLEPPKDKTIES